MRPPGCHLVPVCDHFVLYREDGTKFGSLVDNYPPYGPFSLSVSVFPSVLVYYTKYNDVIPSVLV